MLLLGIRNQLVGTTRVAIMEAVARFRARLFISMLCVLGLKIVCQVLKRKWLIMGRILIS